MLFETVNHSLLPSGYACIDPAPSGRSNNIACNTVLPLSKKNGICLLDSISISTTPAARAATWPDNGVRSEKSRRVATDKPSNETNPSLLLKSSTQSKRPSAEKCTSFKLRDSPRDSRLTFAVPGVESVKRYHSEAPVGLRPIERPSSVTSARTAVTTVSPSGSVTYTITGDLTLRFTEENEILAKPLG